MTLHFFDKSSIDNLLKRVLTCPVTVLNFFPLTETFRDAFNIAAKAVTVKLLSMRKIETIAKLPKLTLLLNSLCQGNKTESGLMVEKVIPG